MLKEISSRSGPLPDRSRFSDPGYWSQRIGGNLKRYFQGSGVFNFDAGGHVYNAPTNKYEITKWSPDLKKKLLVIRRDYKPIPSSESDIQALLE